MEPHLDLTVLNRLRELIILGAGPQMAPGANVPYVMQADGTPKAMPELIFNEYEKPPKRVDTTVTVNDPNSFAEYFTLFKDEDSRIFADESKRSVKAILDQQ